LVEQRIENPRVGGSNPPPGTTPPKDEKIKTRLLRRTGRFRASGDFPLLINEAKLCTALWRRCSFVAVKNKD